MFVADDDANADADADAVDDNEPDYDAGTYVDASADVT